MNEPYGRVTVYRADRAGDLPPRAVAYARDPADPLPVYLWHGTVGVGDDATIARTYTRLTVNDAHALADGLLAAAAAVREIRPDKCPSCGEPTDNVRALDPDELDEVGDRCVGCAAADRARQRREARSRLRIVDAS